MEFDAETYEAQYVTNMYEKIAPQFDQTRFSVWKAVQTFLDDIPNDTEIRIADIGCGNGKNMLSRPENFIGLDNCQAFVDICTARGLNVKHGSILDIPFADNTFDHTICVAVIHHMTTVERRQKAISELIRITKPGGKIFIMVWNDKQISIKQCKQADSKNKQDQLIRWKGMDKETWRYYHLFTKGELDELITSIDITTNIDKSFEEMGNYVCVFTKL